MSAVRATFWNLSGPDLAAHFQARREETAQAVALIASPARRSTGTVVAFKPRRVLTFRGFDDFMPAFRAARELAIAKHGEKWWANPNVCRKGRVPVKWVSWKGKTSSGTSYRDLNMPMGEFWPGGSLPLGPDYAAPSCAAQFVQPAPRRRVTIELELTADAAD